MCFFLHCEQTPNALQMGHIPRIQELPAAPTEEERELPPLRPEGQGKFGQAHGLKNQGVEPAF